MIKQDCVFKNEIIENMKDLKHLRIIFSSSESIKKAQKIKKKTATTTTNKQSNNKTNNAMYGVRGRLKNKANCRLSARSFR